jgi:hypothetical protein
MRINEVADITTDPTPNPQQLMGLVELLSGLANNSNAQKQIDQDAFVSLAQSLGIRITKNMLPDIINLPPLSNMLEPLRPNSTDPIVYKGGDTTDTTEPPAMPVDRARDIVAKSARSAMKRGLKK